ncbi:MAG: hypothetical protein KC586_12205, partial [Myxococcales bacterium]|nr:hypothetical protein [Myxococcales bacterium]
MSESPSEDGDLSPEAEIERWEAELRSAPSDPSRRGRLSYAIARVYEHAMGDPKKASTHYQAALDAMPEHLPSVRGLRRTLLARKSWQAALPLYDRELRLLSDPSRKAGLLLAKGRLLEDALDQKADARKAYETAFELDRTHVGVLRALADRCADDKSWDALDRVLEQTANVVTADPRHRAILVAERAHLAELRAQDAERATELFETALRLDPRAPGALAALKRLHHTSRRWRDLARVLATEAELADDAKVRVAAWSRVGTIQADRLGNRAEGIAALEKAAELAPDDLDVLGALARLYDDAARWDALATTLEAAARVAPDEDRVGFLHRLGAVHEHRLGSPEQAVHWYRAALAIDATHESTLRAVEPLLVEGERWEDLIALRRAEAEATRDDTRRASALQRVAELLERRGDVDAAIERYKLVVELDNVHVEAIESLDRLYEATERWPELAGILDKEVQVAASPDDILTLQYRLGQVSQLYLGQVDSAIERYQEILAAAPEHEPARRALEDLFAQGVSPLRIGEILEPLYRMNEAWDRLIGVHEVQLHYQGDAGERVMMMHRIAEIAEDRASDHDKAFFWMQRALLEDPAHDHTLGEVERLGGLLQGWAQLASTYADSLALPTSGEQKL